MTSLARFGAAASMMAVAGSVTSPAHAAQTAAGSTITNKVDVTYKVGGVTQPKLSATDVFTVDRKINLTVVQDGTATTVVAPDQRGAVTTFLISNLSNAPIDIGLAASNLGGDNFEVTNFKYYRDTNGDATYTPGTDLEVTYLDQVEAETTNIRVFVVADIPLGGATDDVANIRLTAIAAEATAAGSRGAVIVETTTTNTSGVDTVFADSNADGNVVRDGMHFAQDSYTIRTAVLSVLKTSRIVSDPFNMTTNPKMIPGATVEYCIAVNNSAGAPATDVAITDTLVGTTYEPSFGVKVNGTVTGATCNTDGNASGSHSSGVITGTIPSITAGDTRTVLFRVII